MGEGIGDRFHNETKYYRDRMPVGSLDFRAKPKPYKDYSGNRQVALPSVDNTPTMTLDETLRERRSVRDFAPDPISEKQLAYLLWASTGIQRTEGGYEFRTAPSAGALYPIETYVVVNRVGDIAPGVYHYHIRNHALEEVRLGSFGRAAACAALEQDMCAYAPAVIIWTAMFARSKWKYKQRAYRYVYLDAGHIAENLALAAAGTGLGSCQIGAIFDEEANEIVDVDGVEESVIYMSVIGLPI